MGNLPAIQKHDEEHDCEHKSEYILHLPKHVQVHAIDESKSSTM